MSATTYEQTSTARRTGHNAKRIAAEFGEAVLAWLARIGERSPGGRAAARYQRLNALNDAQLAQLDMKRDQLVERCFGWRAYY